jgi:hypothetical protein
VRAERVSQGLKKGGQARNQTMEHALAMSSDANSENVSVSLSSNNKTDELSKRERGSLGVSSC